METWVVSADFSKNGSFESSSPLVQSLYSLQFQNFCIFNHNDLYNPSPKRIQLTRQVRLNPMSKFARIARFTLRKLGGSSSRRLFGSLSSDYLGFMIPHNLRHFLYKNILSELDPGDFVFLVDSRDLIFQVSPNILSRELAAIGDLHFFDERARYFKRPNRYQQISLSETNKKWLTQLENSHADLLTSSENWIINSGCIAGTARSLLQFLESSTNLIARSNWRFDCILDQAATNLIAYSNSIPDVKIHENGKYVINMCGVISGDFKIRDGIFIRNEEVIPVVHQWDRFGEYHAYQGLSFQRRDYCSLAKISD